MHYKQQQHNNQNSNKCTSICWFQPAKIQQTKDPKCKHNDNLQSLWAPRAALDCHVGEALSETSESNSSLP